MSSRARRDVGGAATYRPLPAAPSKSSTFDIPEPMGAIGRGHYQSLAKSFYLPPSRLLLAGNLPITSARLLLLHRHSSIRGTSSSVLGNQSFDFASCLSLGISDYETFPRKPIQNVARNLRPIPLNLKGMTHAIINCDRRAIEISCSAYLFGRNDVVARGTKEMQGHWRCGIGHALPYSLRQCQQRLTAKPTCHPSHTVWI